LRKRRDAQDSETERYGLEAGPRANDRTVDETVPAMSVMFVLMLMLAQLNRL
jgi:hypothetical protein